LLSRCIAETALTSWLIGWRSRGNAAIIFMTAGGTAERDARSSLRPLMSAAVGTSPVRRSQRIASGCVSPPFLNVGSFAWHSGIERPRKRMLRRQR
jgi:hypothetical protein